MRYIICTFVIDFAYRFYNCSSTFYSTTRPDSNKTNESIMNVKMIIRAPPTRNYKSRQKSCPSLITTNQHARTFSTPAPSEQTRKILYFPSARTPAFSCTNAPLYLFRHYLPLCFSLYVRSFLFRGFPAARANPRRRSPPSTRDRESVGTGVR